MTPYSPQMERPLAYQNIYIYIYIYTVIKSLQCEYFDGCLGNLPAFAQTIVNDSIRRK